MSFFKPRTNEHGETKREYEERLQRNSQAKKQEDEDAWTLKLRGMRDRFDKRPRPTLEELREMDISEVRPLRYYSEDGGHRGQPRMVGTGDAVTRVPGGWIYQFTYQPGSVGGGAGISAVFIPFRKGERGN